MDRFCFELVRAAAGALPFPEPIVEVASAIVPGQEAVSDLRRLFPGKRYLGCDLQAGPGVDRIEDLTRLSLADGEAGSFISLNTLEHVWDLFAAAREIQRVLRPGGTLLVSSVFHFEVHEYPADYWRFTDVALRRLFPACQGFVSGQQGNANTPRVTFGLGVKGEAAALPALDLPALAAGLERDGREDPGLFDRARIRLGYHLLKKRAFRDFVHAHEVRLRRWSGETVLETAGWEA